MADKRTKKGKRQAKAEKVTNTVADVGFSAYAGSQAGRAVRLANKGRKIGKQERATTFQKRVKTAKNLRNSSSTASVRDSVKFAKKVNKVPGGGAAKAGAAAGLAAYGYTTYKKRTKAGKTVTVKRRKGSKRKK